MRPFHTPSRFFILCNLSLVLLLLGVQPASAQRQIDAVPEGLTASDWQGIRAAYEAGRHAFRPKLVPAA